MVFSDLFFLFVFLPAFILLYSLASLADKALKRQDGRPRHTFKNMALVLFSLIFYAWGEPVYVILMVITVLLNYLSARWMVSSRHHRKMAFVTGLVANLLILGSFKYLGFFARILVDLHVPLAVPQIGLPIGISFYIFQSISYLADVYREESPAQKRYVDLLLYISMFPQLIAGPIVRYGSIAREINDRRVSVEDMSDGIFRFVIGLGKKVILANQFSEIADQFLANGLPSLSTGGAWVGIIAFTFQIYFDFSGYSDMAIGMGRCLGFHFPENFNHPYCSRSITEFWRRWHISLGSFFRDYVYIPLGGNRRRQVLNILIVWFLTGMWHGASWNFIIWGLYFGLIVMVEKFTILPWSKHIPRPLLYVYSLLLIVLGWGIFYFEDMSAMKVFFAALFGHTEHPTDFTVASAIFDNFWLWTAAILFCMPVRGWVTRAHSKLTGRHKAVHATISVTTQIVVSAVLLTASVALLVGATNNAFLYTRF
ncbi:MAG: MBOAT family protein [Muribaculaceae bacterium]|nr:MBOAT family protein [Muribaculaceae bacterium]